MKRTFMALLITVAMLTLPATVYAEDVTTGSMTVSYEYTALTAEERAAGERETPRPIP